MRDEIIQLYESGSSSHDLFTAFDKAFREIEKLLEQGVWREFYLKALILQHRVSGSAKLSHQSSQPIVVSQSN